MSVINVLVIDLATAEGRAAYAEFSRPTVEPARIPEALLSSAAIADVAELASLRAMREALVKLRDRAVYADIEVAREIDEVLAVSAVASPGIDLAVDGPSVAERAIEAIGAVDSSPLPPRHFGASVHAHCERTIGALLTAIERELSLGTPGHALLTEAGGRAAVERIAMFAQAVALLAGAPL